MYLSRGNFSISHKCTNVHMAWTNKRRSMRFREAFYSVAVHRGSSHGKSIVGQFHRSGKILPLLPRGNFSLSLSLFLSRSPPISPFISRRCSAYSCSPTMLFLWIYEDANKQGRYFFAGSEWDSTLA